MGKKNFKRFFTVEKSDLINSQLSTTRSIFEISPPTSYLLYKLLHASITTGLKFSSFLFSFPLYIFLLFPSFSFFTFDISAWRKRSEREIDSSARIRDAELFNWIIIVIITHIPSGKINYRSNLTLFGYWSSFPILFSIEVDNLW